MDESQVQERLQKIEELNNELKVAKEMLKDTLENDDAYQEMAEATKVAGNKKKQLQNEIYNQPENQKIVLDIKATREEMVTLKEILSEELIEYRHQHKTESIRTPDGQIKVFKFSVKLSPKPNDTGQ